MTDERRQEFVLLSDTLGRARWFDDDATASAAQWQSRGFGCVPFARFEYRVPPKTRRFGLAPD
ncbi:hypothetical protein J8I87_28665 [Paraburkholderia sp. LEh10]|nr:hypothetical protein [Paraburkholderia sp. LEh10]